MENIKYLFLALLFSQNLVAQDSMTENDYARAVAFMPNQINNKKVFNINIKAILFLRGTGL